MSSCARAAPDHSAIATTQMSVFMSGLRRWRRCGEISATAARQELALSVVDRRLGRRELAAHTDDLALDGEIARQCDRVVVHRMSMVGTPRPSFRTIAQSAPKSISAARMPPWV